MRMGEQIAVQHARVVKQIRVGQVIPLATGIPEVTCSSVLKALEVVIHQHFLVRRIVVTGWEIKPAAARTIVRCCRIVLGFPRVGLNPSGVGILGKRLRAQQSTEQDNKGDAHGR